MSGRPRRSDTRASEAAARRSTPAPADAGGAPSPAPPAGSRSGARSSGRPRSSAPGGRAARGCAFVVRLDRLDERGPRVARVGSSHRGIEAGELGRRTLEHEPVHGAHQPHRKGIGLARRPTVDARPAVASTDPAPRRRRPPARAACRRGETPAPGSRRAPVAKPLGQQGAPPLGPQGAVVPALGGGAQRRRGASSSRRTCSARARPGLCRPCDDGTCGRWTERRPIQIAREGEQRAGVAQAQPAHVAHAPVRAQELAQRQVPSRTYATAARASRVGTITRTPSRCGAVASSGMPASVA